MAKARVTGRPCPDCGGQLIETLRSIDYLGVAARISVFRTCYRCHLDTAVEINAPLRGRAVAEINVKAGPYL